MFDEHALQYCCVDPPTFLYIIPHYLHLPSPELHFIRSSFIFHLPIIVIKVHEQHSDLLLDGVVYQSCDQQANADRPYYHLMEPGKMVHLEEYDLLFARDDGVQGI